MNEQLEQKGIEFLTWLLETIKQTKDVVVDKAPEVVRQLLEYRIIEHLTAVIITFIISLVSIPLVIHFFKLMNKNRYETRNAYHDAGDLTSKGLYFQFLVWVFTIFSIISMGVFIGNLVTLLQIYLTPYAYLIHQFIRK